MHEAVYQTIRLYQTHRLYQAHRLYQTRLQTDLKILSAMHA